ncbi:MAG: TIGR00730 family Rossman fold protein [Leptospiraceae bacterium]|nr:TIGR00730 family Rossman fold protein [Leptospiraceae bacterium]
MIEPHKNQEFLFSNEARSLRILGEYIYPKTVLEKQNIQDAIVIFGSARIHPDAKEGEQVYPLTKYYTETVKVAGLLTKWAKSISKTEVQDRLVICTGGGPGIMEAGNRGAREAGGRSIALNIRLPAEQESNPYVDNSLSFTFHYFFMRKLWFMQVARALIVMPGGFGTMDELFEILTLIQTQKSTRVPVVLYGKEFWHKLINFPLLVEYGLISKEDLELFHFSDSPEDTLEHLQKNIPL